MTTHQTFEQYVDWLYEGRARKRCYRVTYENVNQHTRSLAYCSQAITADNEQEAISFALQLIKFEYPDDAADMKLTRVFRLPDDHKGRV